MSDAELHARCIREDREVGPGPHSYWFDRRENEALHAFTRIKATVAELTDDIDLLTDTGRNLAAYIVSQPTPAERYDLMVAVLWSLLECLAPPLACSHPLGAKHVARLAAKARAERAARKLRQPPSTE